MTIHSDPANPNAARLQLSARLDRALINTQGGSVRYLVVNAKAPADPVPEGAVRQPLNLGLVIDASGSMSGPRLEAAKSAGMGVTKSLRPIDCLSIVSFGTHAKMHLDGVRMDEDGQQAAARALMPLTSRDATDLGAGWLMGCESVARQQALDSRAARNHVMLLSDGHANRGECNPEALKLHAHELQQRGVLTSTVGIGTGYSPVQLQAIAEAGGGRMHDAERPEEIIEIVMAELSETLRTTVESLEVDLQLPPGVQAEVYGTAPSMRTTDRFSVLLGSMTSGTNRSLVVKLTFPDGREGRRLPLKVAARWRRPGSDAVLNSSAPELEHCYAPAGACKAQSRDQQTAQTVAEQWHAHIMHRTMTLNQDNQFEAAEEFAQRENRYFEKYANGLPGMRQLVRELDRFAPSAGVLYQACDAKEVMLRAYKSGRGEEDRRSRKRGDYESFMPPQPPQTTP